MFLLYCVLFYVFLQVFLSFSVFDRIISYLFTKILISAVDMFHMTDVLIYKPIFLFTVAFIADLMFRYIALYVSTDFAHLDMHCANDLQVFQPFPFINVCNRLCLKSCYDLLQGMTVDETVRHLSTSGVLQPVLFRLGDQYYVKLDNTALSIVEPSCFIDCIDFLVEVFFVFHVQYPPELMQVFQFLEAVKRMPPSNSRVVAEFFRAVS